jgi:ubiquinone/menaquinone biosynthesis C-methylase UbiE
MTVSKKEHWEHVYETKGAMELSWYQPVPEKSMELIRKTSSPLDTPIIDVGGGASTLVDLLVRSHHSDITVLDIARNALDKSRERLGEHASEVQWVESDVLEFEPQRRYCIWHDRAVFHFQVETERVQKYLEVMRKSLTPNGFFALSTFGPEGPQRCSNLPTRRYSVDELSSLLGSHFDLVVSEIEDHLTPGQVHQQFLYTLWRAKDSW